MSGRTEVVDSVERSQFEILVDDELAGVAVYRLAPGRITFVHTQIDDAHGGQGLGSALAKAALDAARERGLAVQPDCPFIKAWIGRHPDYADLVR